MNILQIDGGGIKGIIPAIVLEHLEERCGKPLYDVFDLIIGTSTGAIIGGGLAAGVPAADIAQFYLTDGVKLFKKMNGLGLGLIFKVYSRKRFKGVIGNIKLPGSNKKIESLTLENLKTNYIATAFNLCSQRTHFIKSFQKEDKELNLLDVISWSALTAAHFFGSISVDDYKWYIYEADATRKEEKKGAVFQDGGQGIYNNTMSHILTEILANYHAYPDHYILSLGTGSVSHYQPYEKWKGKNSSSRERRNFSSLFTNQARRESTPSQLISARYVARLNDNIKFTRIDTYIDKDKDSAFDVKYVDDYKTIGRELCDKVTDEVLDELYKHKHLHLDSVA